MLVTSFLKKKNKKKHLPHTETQTGVKIGFHISVNFSNQMTGKITRGSRATDRTPNQTKTKGYKFPEAGFMENTACSS